MDKQIEFIQDYEIVCLGEKEEWVYDIEVKNDHNFFANDILVHNSNYLDCDLIMQKLCHGKDLSKDQQIDILDKFCEKMIVPKLEEWFNDLGTYLNVREQKIEMKREAIADRGVWRGAKNYILNVWDNEGVRYKEPKLKIMGIEAVKSSTPGVCRKAIKDVFKIIMNGEYDEMKEYVTKFKKEFDSLEFEDIAFPRGVKVLNDYGDSKDIYRKGTPAHVRASLLYNFHLKKNKLDNKYPIIYNGDKIKFMYLKMPNPIGDNVIACSDVLPKEFGLEKFLDRERQFEQSFVSVIESILDIVDWPLEEKSSLEDFFS